MPSFKSLEHIRVRYRHEAKNTEPPSQPTPEEFVIYRPLTWSNKVSHKTLVRAFTIVTPRDIDPHQFNYMLKDVYGADAELYYGFSKSGWLVDLIKQYQWGTILAAVKPMINELLQDD